MRQSDAKMHPRTVTYHRNTLNVIWRNAGRPSPWAAIPRYTGTGFHSLRHTFATICAKAGIPQGSVAAWLGHTPAVDEIYQHFGSKDTARIVGALPSGVFAGTLALPAKAPPPDELRKDIRKRLKKATPAQLQKIADVFSATA